MEDIERVEKVEQIVKKAGCSYADAKAALERHDWNMLDALIDLEDGNATFVESEVIDRDNARRYQSADFNMNPGEKHFKDIGNDAGAGSQKTSGDCRGRGGKVRDFFTRLWQIITGNYLNVYNKQDRLLLHIPVIVPVILFLVQFWLMLILCVVLLLIGFRFQFEGADLGKSTINSAMDNAANAAYNAGQRVKTEFSTPNSAQNNAGQEYTANNTGASSEQNANTSYSDHAANGN